MKIPNRTVRVQNKHDKYFVPSYSLIPTPLFGRVQDQMLSAKMRTAGETPFAVPPDASLTVPPGVTLGRASGGVPHSDRQIFFSFSFRPLAAANLDWTAV